MQYEVPQFIEHETKILGPLTLRQTMYVAIGGGIIFLMRLFKVEPLIFIAVAIPVAALTIALAFIPVAGRPFSTFLGNFFKFSTKPRVFVWKQKLPIFREEPQKIKVIEKPIYEKPETKRMEAGESRLKKLGRKIEIGA